MNAALYRARRRLLEFLRYNPASGFVLSHALQTLARFPFHPLKRLATLAHAARLFPRRHRSVQINRAIQSILADLDFDQLDWNTLDPSGQSHKHELPKALLVKPPVSPLEKGLIYTTFENQWLRLLRHADLGRLARDYDLLLGPSYSPPPGPEMLLLLQQWPGRVYSLLSNHDDAVLLQTFSPRIHTLPLLASSWVDPAPFESYLGTPKDFDLVMLANFSPLKRHWLFFDMLGRLPRHLRVLLLGVPMDGRGEKELRDEAAVFGVADRFELILKPTRQELMRGLARSRVSLVFSQQEGACIAVSESLFADTPVGLFRTARIGSKAFLNGWTGRLLDRGRLDRDVMEFIEEADRYRPRAWAMENISCHVSLARLNRLLREQAGRDGLPWTRDVVPFTKHTVPVYLNAEVERRMMPAVEEFQARHGLRLGLSRPATPVSLVA